METHEIGVKLKTFKTPKGTELPLMDLKGKPYLQVAHRIVWFLEEKSEWVIKTYIVERTDSFIIMKAVICDETGKIRAEAHKCSEFKDNELEKTETGAIGRALAFLGYGTQFCSDELNEGDRLADSPVSNGGQVAENSIYFPVTLNPEKNQNHHVVTPVRTAIVKNYLPTNHPQDTDVKSLGEYQITFGKFKSRNLKSFGIDELVQVEDYCKFLASKSKEDGKPTSKNVLELDGVVKAYFNELNSKQQQVPF